MTALAVVAAIIVADQVTKALIVKYLELGEASGFIPHVIRFYRTENTGAAFSMLKDSPEIFIILSSLAMCAIVVILYREYRRHPLLTLSLSMVLGGGIGNMIDRIRLGYVVDFLDFEFFDFAVFNVADSFITVGTVMLAVYLLFFEPKIEKRQKAEQEAASEEVAVVIAADGEPVDVFSAPQDGDKEDKEKEDE
ncbi:MAG: signal peptidase II [Clostridia bacterium]|nr:signal peptidase II [Clostridia bacterium]